MKKTNWRYKFLIFFAKRIMHVPFIVDFTQPAETDLYAVGFAWTPQAANRMRGDDLLIERLAQETNRANIASGTRKARRVANRAALKAAKKVISDVK